MNIEKFKKIFAGLERAYGQYIPGNIKNGKKSGNAFIKRSVVTDTLWKNHLQGVEPSLGIIPIRDDSTCSWGCVDVDTYPLDHTKLVKQIKELGLPLIVCRSKSGGAHIFLFGSTPLDAEELRNKLTEIAGALGHGACEIFPKQIKINAERGDTGNFLNLPYFNGNEGNRYAFLDDGKAATLEEFYSLWEERKIDPEKLSKIKSKRKKEPPKELADGPPCLQTLIEVGITEGGRDNTLYQYAIYAKKKYEDWQNRVAQFNQKHIEPNLEFKDVQKTITQHEKKDYQYKCKDQPMCAHCDAITCRTREFGIGNDYEHKFSDLRKYQSDNSVWFMNVDGNSVCLTTRQLYNQNEFILACLDQRNVVLNPLNRREWHNKIKELVAQVDVIEMEDVRKEERFDQHLESFINDQGHGLSMDEVRMGKTFTEEGKTYFRMVWLENYLEKKKFKGFDATRIGARIRELNGNDNEESCVIRRVRGKNTRLWWVTEMEKPKEDLPLPKADDEEVPF